MSDSNSNSYGIRIPKYNEKHEHHFMMWVMKMRAYVVQQKLSPILFDTFKASLPDTEDNVLDAKNSDDQLKQRKRWI